MIIKLGVSRCRFSVDLELNMYEFLKNVDGKNVTIKCLMIKIQHYVYTHYFSTPKKNSSIQKLFGYISPISKPI